MIRCRRKLNRYCGWVREIHRNIDELIAKFDKAENQKAVETEMTREFKKVRQLLSNIGQKDPQVERYKRIAMEVS